MTPARCGFPPRVLRWCWLRVAIVPARAVFSVHLGGLATGSTPCGHAVDGAGCFLLLLPSVIWSVSVKVLRF